VAGAGSVDELVVRAAVMSLWWWQKRGMS
jgi:hypothetical protein